MAEKIGELEKVALSDKPWQLAGEATAQTRPENSMLAEDVDFDQTSRRGRCILAGCQLSEVPIMFFIKQFFQNYMHGIYSVFFLIVLIFVNQTLSQCLIDNIH